MSELVAVCVPALNEAERLPALLAALATQTVPATVVISLNNTTDDSHLAIDRAKQKYPSLRLVVDNVAFPPCEANAGSARRRAMEIGLQVVGDNGQLISTDADTRPPAHWISANVTALKRGLDIVGGQIRLDEEEDISCRLRASLAATARYWSAVRTIEDTIDPVCWDPPPRHGDHTGASLALSATAYRRSGGLPRVATGEDRGLVQAVCCTGGRLGHPAEVWTRVSSRTVGRAKGGMAQDMDRLIRGSTIMLPHYDHWRARARWRRTIREQFGSAEVCVRENALPELPCDMAISSGEIASA